MRQMKRRTDVLFLCFLILIFGVSAAFGQGLSRKGDLRPKVPERWAEAKKYTLDFNLGGAALDGNVDTENIAGGLNLKTIVDEKREILLEASAGSSSFNGARIQEKAKGSFLYVYKWKPHVNLFFNSTIGRNTGTKLKRRVTTSLPGICWHKLFPDQFDIFLVSLAPTIESVTYDTAAKRDCTRATIRLNFERAVSASAKLGGDFLYIPNLSDFADYQTYMEPYLQFAIVPDKYSFKITYSDEFDSRPLAGVLKSDRGLFYAFTFHFQK
jgi:hypothetical protein